MSNDQGKWEQIPMAAEVTPQQYAQQQYVQQQPQVHVVYAQAVPQQQYVQTGAPGQMQLVRGDQGYYSTMPRRIQCQFCRYEVVTGVSHETGLMTHLCALGLCFIGCWPCCLLPYCMADCQDTVHVCPNCHQIVGKKQAM